MHPIPGDVDCCDVRGSADQNEESDAREDEEFVHEYLSSSDSTLLHAVVVGTWPYSDGILGRFLSLKK